MKNIDISLLKKYVSNLKSEKDKFNSTTYNTFSSSYINRCTDNNIVRMKNNLENLYKQIEQAYNNIDNWLTDYSDDLGSLETVLSNDGKTGSIKEGSIRNYVSANLKELPDYTNSFSEVFNLNFGNSIVNTNVLTYAIFPTTVVMMDGASGKPKTDSTPEPKPAAPVQPVVPVIQPQPTKSKKNNETSANDDSEDVATRFMSWLDKNTPDWLKNGWEKINAVNQQQQDLNNQVLAAQKEIVESVVNAVTDKVTGANSGISNSDNTDTKTNGVWNPASSYLTGPTVDPTGPVAEYPAASQNDDKTDTGTVPVVRPAPIVTGNGKTDSNVEDGAALWAQILASAAEFGLDFFTLLAASQNAQIQNDMDVNKLILDYLQGEENLEYKNNALDIMNDALERVSQDTITPEDVEEVVVDVVNNLTDLFVTEAEASEIEKEEEPQMQPPAHPIEPEPPEEPEEDIEEELNDIDIGFDTLNDLLNKKYNSSNSALHPEIYPGEIVELPGGGYKIVLKGDSSGYGYGMTVGELYIPANIDLNNLNLTYYFPGDGGIKQDLPYVESIILEQNENGTHAPSDTIVFVATTNNKSGANANNAILGIMQDIGLDIGDDNVTVNSVSAIGYSGGTAPATVVGAELAELCPNATVEVVLNDPPPNVSERINNYKESGTWEGNGNTTLENVEVTVATSIGMVKSTDQTQGIVDSITNEFGEDAVSVVVCETNDSSKYDPWGAGHVAQRNDHFADLLSGGDGYVDITGNIDGYKEELSSKNT